MQFASLLGYLEGERCCLLLSALVTFFLHGLYQSYSRKLSVVKLFLLCQSAATIGLRQIWLLAAKLVIHIKTQLSKAADDFPISSIKCLMLLRSLSAATLVFSR
ncbi:hypothetical protein L1987_39009 [Smallanthus sonchifolius]|uniref:Uncharacterized protein n=1 Tax=Smallanthus sonchifolius TaxID=185202 RepID=A0ACB9HLI6_9ASTR|nr:hypothetical protein L1987_39009 [Smallanthus sonchifolius]